MRNAKKMDSRITVGRVPDEGDLSQLKDLGYKTLVDVRQEDEKFGGFVERNATEIGLRYVNIPIERERITIDCLKQFYKAVFEKGSAPLYVFSRFGKKPVAFLLLLEVVANGEPLGRVFKRASRMGMNLHGDLALRSFLVEFFNAQCIDEILQSIREYRPDLLRKPGEEEAVRIRQAITYSGRDEREAILGQRGCTVWLTGIPSSGKSTTAFTLETDLLKRGRLAYVLDSDNVRHGINQDLGFTKENRTENIRRIGEITKLFADVGIITITSFISPYRKDREAVRELHKAANLGFIEVFIDAQAEVCERRDSRGLYKRAWEGELTNFTGVDAPYEPPLEPDLVVPTSELTPAEASARIIKCLADKGLLDS